MYTYILSALAFTATALALPASTASSDPTVGPASIGISLSPATDCSVLASGYPGSLTSGTCYAVPADGIRSFTYYTEPSSYGSTMIYASSDCSGNGTSYSLERLGCSGDTGFAGQSIRYVSS